MSEYVILTNKEDLINIADIVREKADLDDEMTLGQIASAIDEYWETQPKPYLKFSSPETFSINVTNPSWDGTIEYSTDRTTWNTWDGSQISGTKLYFRGTNNTKMCGISSNYAWTITGSNVSCKGNIENLLDYATVANGEHPNMAQYCYSSMFYGCTALIKAPELPATTLTDYCYEYMFYGCINLTTAPSILPATNLTQSCYYAMFRGCSSLIAPPELPATELVTECYGYMFFGCTSLATLPVLPATTVAYMCYYFMFYNCTSLTQVPELPANTLSHYCYYAMFWGCSNIKLSTTQTDEYTQEYRIPTSGTGTAANYSFTSMFKYSGGTFTDDPTINTTYYLHKDCTIVPAS